MARVFYLLNDPFIHQGPVVRKRVNANLELKAYQGSCFSFSKKILKQIPSDCLKTTKVKM